MRALLLASGSPRRKELLELAGIPFTAVPSSAPEISGDTLSPEETALENAFRKASSVSETHPGAVVLGADTLVWCDGHALGKPADREDARRMLKMLSGRTHRVLTGVYVTDGTNESRAVVSTDVTFFDLSPDLIERYLDTGEYKDKAGAYGIQGKGCILAERLNGDYFNIVGLPIGTVYRMLEPFLKEDFHDGNE
ncbi:MAG: septum formation protein Maf [Clostridia bacterium]|nr:septum formation protein Maf [Clostridia bacterium]